MNATSKTYFEKNFSKFQEEYAEIRKEIQEYKEKHGIKSHTLGDITYYRLCIKEWEKYRQIRMVRAILKDDERMFIRNDIPFIKSKISFCRNCISELGVRK